MVVCREKKSTYIMKWEPLGRRKELGDNIQV